MTQIHVVIRRVSPALKVDFVQVGRFVDGKFEVLPFVVIESLPISRFLESSDITDSRYVKHSKITELIAACEGLPSFCVEFFDNTFVLMFEFDLDHDEVASEEKGEGH